MNAEKKFKVVKGYLKIVLDFVERYNKQDKEVDVANAAQFLENFIDTP